MKKKPQIRIEIEIEILCVLVLVVWANKNVVENAKLSNTEINECLNIFDVYINRYYIVYVQCSVFRISKLFCK